MTNEDKLKKFRELTLKTAEEKRDSAIREYQNTLDLELAEYETERKKLAEEELLLELDHIRRINNDDYSKQLHTIKREFSQILDEMNDRIFEELLERISTYKKGTEYKAYLSQKIEQVKAYVKYGDARIYIDPSDCELKEELAALAGNSLLVSDESFLGGIKAIVNGNMLIDFSFKSKIDELRENFSLTQYAANNVTTIYAK